MRTLNKFRLASALKRSVTLSGGSSGGGGDSATQLMRASMLTDSPLVIFGMDEYTGAGNLAETTSGGRSLTLQGDAPSSSSVVSGIKGLTFSGSGYFANGSVFNDLADISTGLTIEYLFRATNNSSGIFNFTCGSQVTRRIGAKMQANLFEGFEFRDSAGLNYYGIQEGNWFIHRITSGKWVHVALTISTDSSFSNFELFINGNSINADSLPSTFAIDSNRKYITLGAQGNVEYLNGSMANFAVYKSVLTSQRINAHYQALGIDLKA